MNTIRLLVLFISLSTISYSQSQKKTDVNTDIDILKVYTQVVKEGYGTQKIYKELANGCYFKNNYKASKKWFEKYFETEKNPDKIQLFRYQQSLKALGIFSEKQTNLAIIGNH